MCFSLFASYSFLASHLLFPKEPPDREAGWKTASGQSRRCYLFPTRIGTGCLTCSIHLSSANPTNKYNLMYSSQEMKFHAIPDFSCPGVGVLCPTSPHLSSSQSPSPPKQAGAL